MPSTGDELAARNHHGKHPHEPERFDYSRTVTDPSRGVFPSMDATAFYGCYKGVAGTRTQRVRALAAAPLQHQPGERTCSSYAARPLLPSELAAPHERLLLYLPLRLRLRTGPPLPPPVLHLSRPKRPCLIPSRYGPQHALLGSALGLEGVKPNQRFLEQARSPATSRDLPRSRPTSPDPPTEAPREQVLEKAGVRKLWFDGGQTPRVEGVPLC